MQREKDKRECKDSVHQSQKSDCFREAADCGGLTVMPRYNFRYLALSYMQRNTAP